MGPNSIATHLQSAAPVIVESMKSLSTLYEEFWETGTYSLARRPFFKPKNPNPTFVSLMTDRSTIHYGTDPLLGFHLAPAYSSLLPEFCEQYAGQPPLPNHRRAIEEARAQFRSWGLSFTRSCRQDDPLVLRFFAGDALAFCQTLQLNQRDRDITTANLFCDQWHLQRLTLDEGEYGSVDGAPLSFNVIDTSNLVDRLGGLNILAATAPLLDENLTSTLYTETASRQQKGMESMVEDLFCGHLPTFSHLLGLFPVEYWANLKNNPELGEAATELCHEADKVSCSESYHRTTWKRPLSSVVEKPEDTTTVATLFNSIELSHLLYRVYLKMFRHEDMDLHLRDKHFQTGRKTPTPKYHRGSFVAFICAISHRVIVEWRETIIAFLQLVNNDSTLTAEMNFVQELYVMLHIFGIYLEPTLVEFPAHSADSGEDPLFEVARIRLAKIPATCITLRVPRANLDSLASKIQPLKHGTPPVHCVLQSTCTSGDGAWRYSFAVLQLAFGEVKRSDPGERAVALHFVEDEQGWAGDSPLLVSFWAPGRFVLLEQQPVGIVFRIQSTPQTALTLLATLGMDMNIYETHLGDRDSVFLSDCAPLQSRYPCACRTLIEAKLDELHGASSYVVRSATIQKDTAQIASLTYRYGLPSDKEKLVPSLGGSIETVQVQPSVITLDVGKGAHCFRLRFSVPVIGSRSFKHVVRESSFVEITAPMASPLDKDVFPGFMYPLFMNAANPIVWNMPYIHINSLPKLDFSSKEEMIWILRHACFMFQGPNSVKTLEDIKAALLGDDALYGFKASLIRILMVTAHPSNGQMQEVFMLTDRGNPEVDLFIFVSGLRLDAPNQTFVLDAAILPGKIPELPQWQKLLNALSQLDTVAISVSDGTLNIWKTVLPAYVERCREWEHQPLCSYLAAGQIPVPNSYGGATICSCGSGKLPRQFMRNVRGWKVMSEHATRAAISLAFPVPGVEHVFGGLVASSPDQPGETCHRCGVLRSQLTRNLLRCARCHAVRYCSINCQHRDWKEHKSQCIQRKSCGSCGKSEALLGKELLTCANCRIALYCSTECQEGDWKEHKRMCAREGEYGRQRRELEERRGGKGKQKEQSGQEGEDEEQSGQVGEQEQQSDKDNELEQQSTHGEQEKQKGKQNECTKQINNEVMHDKTNNRENELEKKSDQTPDQDEKQPGKEPEHKRNGGKENDGRK